LRFKGRIDVSAKPVYDRLLALIMGEWWTHTEGRTNASGEFSARACSSAPIGSWRNSRTDAASREKFTASKME
jgi:hypothetical protein